MLRARSAERRHDSDALHQEVRVTNCFKWCPGEDSNLHELLHWYLKPARLPVPPPGQDDHPTRGAEMYALPRGLSTNPLLGAGTPTGERGRLLEHRHANERS